MQKIKTIFKSAFLFKTRQYAENKIFENFMFLKLKGAKSLQDSQADIVLLKTLFNLESRHD